MSERDERSDRARPAERGGEAGASPPSRAPGTRGAVEPPRGDDLGPSYNVGQRSRIVSLRVAIGVGFALCAVSLGVLVHRLARDADLGLEGATGAFTKRPLTHEWKLQNGKHWQIVASPTETRDDTDKREKTRGACGVGQVEVKGNMKVDERPFAFYDPKNIEELQKTTCTKWINKEFPERCASFDRDKWLALSKDLPTKPMHYCIDRFEYPNQKGAYPYIMVTWPEGQELCAAEGKRLCSEDEWTFACEGEEAMPYPYGYERDPAACISDQHWKPYTAANFSPRDGVAAMGEMDKLWQGKASGEQTRCRSPFGVYDMTGNVDEWTRSVRPGERPTILKGGYWGPVRTRCRPSTRSHDDKHSFYQQGFRCCSDVPAKRPLGGEVPGAAVRIPEAVR